MKVTFTADGVPSVTVLQDQQPAQVSGGYGGWSVVQRQRRVGLTEWQGVDPIRMQIPVLFDGFADGISQEIAISHLSRMALPPSVGGEPPVVQVRGLAVPKPGPRLWVIETLSWGTNVLWDTSTNGVTVRLRQDCTVGLLQYRADDRTVFSDLAPATIGGKSKAGWPKQYIVQKNDTLQVVAAKYYNDSTKWHKIATANNIRDPRNLVGIITLTVPAP